jgi:ribA/ribD-fused uncharacterized protein
MAVFPSIDDTALFISRSDPNEPLGSFSMYGFELEGVEWPSVEHYFQAMKFVDDVYREKIRQAPHPQTARKLGRRRLKKIRSDWSQVKDVIMTRAVYIRCRTYPNLAEQLLATGDRQLVENSQYDYYWGCGRDRRGNNAYGKVLMSVRSKLLEESLGSNLPKQVL